MNHFWTGFEKQAAGNAVLKSREDAEKYFSDIGKQIGTRQGAKAGGLTGLGTGAFIGADMLSIGGKRAILPAAATIAGMGAAGAGLGALVTRHTKGRKGKAVGGKIWDAIQAHENKKKDK